MIIIKGMQIYKSGNAMNANEEMLAGYADAEASYHDADAT